MQDHDGNTEKEIAALLQKQIGAKEIASTDYDKGIGGLVGIDGADAIDFLKEYSTQFHVDMTDFVFQKYFGNEGFDLVQLVLRLIGKRQRCTPISIRQLAIIAKSGKWPLSDDA